MDEKIAQQVLDELLPALETLETQSAAILQFLKDKKIASDKELAPFFEQAANASSVRCRAARLRMDRLLSGAAKTQEAEREEPRETLHKDQKQAQETGDPCRSKAGWGRISSRSRKEPCSTKG